MSTKLACSLSCSLFAALCIVGCGSQHLNPTSSYKLAVQSSGTGSGTVTSTPAGIDCGNTCSANFDNGTSVVLSAIPASGSSFAGWSGACFGTGSCSVTLSAAATVTATFNTSGSTNKPQLTVQKSGSGGGVVTSNPTGIDCGSTCSARFDSGTPITLSAAPAAGSTFAGWSGACSGTGACTVTLSADTTVTASFETMPPVQLTVIDSGSGSGTVMSNPAGIDCGSTCNAAFASGSSVTLTAAAATGSTFGGWSGSCVGTGPCTVTLADDTTITATFNRSNALGLSMINHIVFLAQEHHSFDNYFGAMREYWARNGYPDQSFDGLPQFNPTSGAAPLQGPAPSIPGCDPNQPPPADCAYDPANLVTSFHLMTQCTENTSPSWNEAHVDWNYYDQIGLYPARMNGFVKTAAHDARTNLPTPFNDSDGIRAMGYYDGDDLNYYYFMASNFATSDRWFHPAMTRTQPNRHFLIAGTSQGRVYPNGTSPGNLSPLTTKTIFEELQAAGITWKIYVNTENSKCGGPPYDPACLISLSYIKNYVWGQAIPTNYPNNIATYSDYLQDVQNGTLPQVAQIEPSTYQNLDEHGTTSAAYPNHVQLGAKMASRLINELMNSPSWKDSVFIFTYDESAGLYDHVSPQPTVSPDGIKPVDLRAGDACTKGTGPTCDFTWTGYRVPLIVISPFTRKNYVSHTVADTTAILKLIETRFNLSPLTNRDAIQPDMTEFFDFNNPPWMTPPSPPTQNTSNSCYLTGVP